MSKVKEAETKVSKKVETASEAPAPKPIKGHIESLSKVLKDGLTFDKASGSIHETGEKGDLYYDNLPANLTKEQDQASEKYRSEFVPALTLAVGHLAVDALAKNSKLDTITSEVQLGQHDTVRNTVHREKTYTFGSGDDKKTVVHKGDVRTEVDIRGAHNVGEQKKARLEIAQYADKHLKK